MNNIELKPTEENLLSTYMSDSIDRNRYLFKFIELLDSIDSECTVAVDGRWGSGKTFFVKQAKMIIDAFNDFTDKNNFTNVNAAIIKEQFNRNMNSEYAHRLQVTVYYDAWENDNDDDPIMSIIYAILQTTTNDYSFSDSINNNLIGIAASIFDFFTGRDIKKIIDAIKAGTSPIDTLKNSHKLKDRINEFFSSLLDEKGDRLIIFVDELDRCKPSFAVKLLERIKHYFDNEQITFVLSVNSIELQKTIKHHYGLDFDACRYLDRFFDLSVIIPPIDMEKFYNLIQFNRSSNFYDSIAKRVISKYRFTLRETIRYVKMIKIAGYKIHHNAMTFFYPGDEAKGLCARVILPVIIGLKLCDSVQYHNFIVGQDSSPLFGILSEEYRYRELKPLLNYDETFYDDQNKKTVNLKDRVQDFYNAVFVETYETQYEVEIGQCRFTKETKAMMHELTSLLSSISYYDAN